MERVSSKQSFLNLNDATISDAGEEERSRTFVPIAKSRVVPDVQVPTDANTPRAAPSINLPMQQSDALKHVSIDIGGSLIKLVYFSPDTEVCPVTGTDLKDDTKTGGRLHFVKFETTNVEDVIAFIESKNLHKCAHSADGRAVVKATGGGAYKYSQLFRDRLGLILEREDEMACVVTGANFLLQELRDEAFTFEKGQRLFIPNLAESDSLYPYLLVNCGSGVSILKVDEENYERVSGTNIGGGTFWGLGRLLTGVKNFDEMLQLSMKGRSENIDMLVGDIYGGMDYLRNLGLMSTTIASSFGRVVMDIDKELDEYKKEDIALSLLRMISYNIAHLAVLNAMKFGLKRIFFGGFFIRGHAYTMETISYAINFWSKGQMQAMFLRHEGFLGALGAYMKYAGNSEGTTPTFRANGTWIERFISTQQSEVDLALRRNASTGGSSRAAGGAGGAGDAAGGGVAGAGGAGAEQAAAQLSGLTVAAPEPEDGPAVGVLYLVPSLEVFPLLRQAEKYQPDTLDLVSDPEEREYWLQLLLDHLPPLVEKAVSSRGGSPEARAQGAAFEAAFSKLLNRVQAEPSSYGQLCLAGIFETREEYLRAFEFPDSYRADKASENAAALAVLPDLLRELSALPTRERLQSIVEGVLAGNIFDWGSRVCVELYQTKTILEIYRKTRSSLSRPWGIDNFDPFSEKLCAPDPATGEVHRYRKALLFCDNSGADLILGMVPLARELLQRGTDVVLVANSLPAINDITVAELQGVLQEVAKVDETVERALHAASGAAGGAARSPFSAARLTVASSGSGSPCLDFRRVSHELCVAARDADLVVLEGMGRAVHTNLRAEFACDAVKLAMIKNGRLAKKIFGGKLYDCVFVARARRRSRNPAAQLLLRSRRCCGCAGSAPRRAPGLAV